MSDPATCRCGRPRATPEDLARWKAEFPADYRGPDPEWARPLCWSNRPITECNMKPLPKDKTP